jgi:hypothetical protein
MAVKVAIVGIFTAENAFGASNFSATFEKS